MKPTCTTIDTRYGTDNHSSFSHGNTLPYTGVPFGMNYFLPQTQHDQGAWFFQPNLPIFQGFRLTHQPSPWIGDYAWLLLTPITGALQQEDLFFRQSSYQLDEAIFQPHYLSIHSERYQIHSELTPTKYGAHMRFQAPQSLSLCLHAPQSIEDFSHTGSECHFHLTEKAHTSEQTYSFYLTLAFNHPIQSVQQLGTDLVLIFDSPEIEVRLGTSYLSPTLAHAHLPQLSFEQTKALAQENWDQLMGRFDLLDTGKEDRRLFDHCLYRLLLFPQTFYEIDTDGNDWHLDVTHNHIRPGKSYTNIGFWDLFRTSFPLYSLVYPDYYRDFLQGFLNSYKDTGFLPKWLAPDERGMMPGTLIDGVIADAVTKQIAPELTKELYQAMLATATTQDPNQHFGRHGQVDYEHFGYLPNTYHESVSHSLDYAYSDYCISQVASTLGENDQAHHYAHSSLSYHQLYDPATGYIRSKSKEGQFKDHFNPFSWGGDYAECSAIQASFGALHDIDGLIQLMGGKETFTQRLLKLANQPAHFDVSGYGYEIHEMSEMAQAPFGQIALSNQPSFHIPYLFRYSNHPEYTSLLIHKLRTHAFHSTFQAYPGDEDNGSLSAWYIWSVLGLYPTCPGKATYDLGLPLFPKIQLYLPDQDHWLTIRQSAHTVEAHFLHQVTLDQVAYERIPHDALVKSKELHFELSWLPAK